MQNRLKAFLTNAALLVVTLGCAEVVLQIANHYSTRAARVLAHPKHRDSPYVFDVDRGFRGNPRRFDHDGRGFRNAGGIEQTEILAIGDSQTYGVGVERQRAWPYAIHEDFDYDVYNMGLGGYAPPHHLFSLDQMLDLKPRVVVYAVYFGNDLMESFAIARDHPELRAHIDDGVWAAAMLQDDATPLEDAIDLFVRRGAPAPEDETDNQSTLTAFRTFVSERVMIYALARAAFHVTDERYVPGLLSRDFEKAKAAITSRERDYCSVYDDGSWRTILTAPYRGFMLDSEDARVEAGFFVMVHALERVIAMADGVGARTVIALIPTKETVFAQRMSELSEHPKLTRLVEDEARYKARLVAALRNRRVTIVDTLAALAGSTRPPYFEDADGHPNMYGHGVLSSVIGPELRGPEAALPRFALEDVRREANAGKRQAP
ncbi:MAG: hypothetical protein RMA76_44180 [Deltaproteobacteria bacterium]|jgi:hypothetical protein